MHVCLIAGTTNSETSQHLEGEIPSAPEAHGQSVTPSICTASDNGVTETSETTAAVEQHNRTADSGDTEQICIEQGTGSDKNHTPHLLSSSEILEKDVPSQRCQTSMTTHLISQTEISAVIKPVVESVPEEAAPEIPECSPPPLKGIYSEEVKLTDEPSVSQRKSSQSHCSSSVQFKSNLEDTNQQMVTVSSTKHEIIESNLNNLSASDTSIVSVEQESNTDSVLAREGSRDCSGLVSPVEDLHVTCKQESEVASALQSRSRLQKVKPKPNLSQISRTGRSKPQVTKNSTANDCNSPPIAKIIPEQTSATPPEKSNESTGTASDLTQSLDSYSSLPLGQEASTAKEKNTDDSVPVQEGSHHCAGFVPPVDDLPLSQKAKNEVSSRRSRSQKVIPKPNLPQTFRSARPKPQTIKDFVEKDLSTTPGLNPEQTCATLPDKTTQSTGPVSDVIPSLDLSPVLIQTEEFSTTEVENIDVGLSGQVGSSSSIATLGQSASEDQNVSKGSHSYTPSRPESNDYTIPKVEAQPTCITVFPEKSSQSIGTASVSVLPLESCTTGQPTKVQEKDAGFGLDSSSENSEPNAPKRRRRFPKVKPKPNLASSTRTTRSTLHMDTSSNVTIEQPSVDNNGAQIELAPTETASKESVSVDSSLSTEPIDSDISTATPLKTSLDSTDDKNILATSWVLENCFTLTDSEVSNSPEVGVGLSSQGNCTVDVPTRATELNTQTSSLSNIRFSQNGSTESKINSTLTTNVNSKLNKKESRHQSCPASDSEARSVDAAQRCSETSETNPTTNNISQSAHR